MYELIPTKCKIFIFLYFKIIYIYIYIYTHLMHNPETTHRYTSVPKYSIPVANPKQPPKQNSKH